MNPCQTCVCSSLCHRQSHSCSCTEKATTSTQKSGCAFLETFTDQAKTRKKFAFRALEYVMWQLPYLQTHQALPGKHSQTCLGKSNSTWETAIPLINLRVCVEEPLGGGWAVGINARTNAASKRMNICENTKQSTSITQVIPRRGNINY